jgi:hypothetical protein
MKTRSEVPSPFFGNSERIPNTLRGKLLMMQQDKKKRSDTETMRKKGGNKSRDGETRRSFNPPVCNRQFY